MSDRAGGRRLPPLLVGLALIAAGLAVLLIGAVATSRYPFAFDRAIIVGLRHWSGPRGCRRWRRTSPIWAAAWC